MPLRTKIVCTLGPASRSPEMVEALFRAGLDVARINMSHGRHEEHSALIATIREVAVKVGKPIGILVDLQGPRIRVGELPVPRDLKEGSRVVFAPEEEAEADEFRPPTPLWLRR